MQDDLIEYENWKRAYHEFLSAKQPRLLNIIDEQGNEEKRARLLYCLQDLLREEEPYKLKTCLINLREKEDFNSTLTMINRISLEMRRYSDSDKRKTVSDKLDQYLKSLNHSTSISAQGISATDHSSITETKQQIVSGSNQDTRIVVSSKTTEILLDAFKSLEQAAIRIVIVIDVYHWKDTKPHDNVVAWLKTFITKLDERIRDTLDCRFVVISHDTFSVYLGSGDARCHISMDQFGMQSPTKSVSLPLESVNPNQPSAQTSANPSNNSANNQSMVAKPAPDSSVGSVPAAMPTPNTSESQQGGPPATSVPPSMASSNAPTNLQSQTGANTTTATGAATSSGLPPTNTNRWPLRITSGNIFFVLTLFLALVIIFLLFRSCQPVAGKPSSVDPTVCMNGPMSAAIPPVTSPLPLPHEIGPNGIGVVQDPKSGESIGISDGRYVLDTNRSNDELVWKRSAAASTKDQAIEDLQKAIKLDPTDAEAHIDLANLQLLQSKKSYITVVVATTVTGSAGDIANGRSDLQGAYIEQMENNSNPSVQPVRILIANSGTGTRNVAQVAQQIVRVKENNATFAGVVGWPTSSESLAAIHILDADNITMISPSASSDALNKVGKNFFRIVPPDSEQGKLAADYAHNTLNRTRALLLCDPTNPYSLTMARSFTYNFTTVQRGSIVFSLPYGVDPAKDIKTTMAKIQAQKPDLIYFTGDSQKFAALDQGLVDLAKRTNASIMGGDTLYDLAVKPDSAYHDIYFTTYAFPDMWDEEHIAPSVPFFKDYPAQFNSDTSTGGSYLRNRPNSEPIVAYDASKALIEGFQFANYDSDGLHDAILNRTSQGIKGFQGASGWINYSQGGDGSSNPVDKVIVVLYVDACGATGKTHLRALNGSLQGSHRDDKFPSIGACT